MKPVQILLSGILASSLLGAEGMQLWESRLPSQGVVVPGCIGVIHDHCFLGGAEFVRSGTRYHASILLMKFSLDGNKQTEVNLGCPEKDFSVPVGDLFKSITPVFEHDALCVIKPDGSHSALLLVDDNGVRISKIDLPNDIRFEHIVADGPERMIAVGKFKRRAALFTITHDLRISPFSLDIGDESLAYSVAKSRTGEYIVAGGAKEEGSSTVWVAQVDGLGAMSRIRKFDTPGMSPMRGPQAVVLSPDRTALVYAADIGGVNRSFLKILTSDFSVLSEMTVAENTLPLGSLELRAAGGHGVLWAYRSNSPCVFEIDGGGKIIRSYPVQNPCLDPGSAPLEVFGSQILLGFRSCPNSDVFIGEGRLVKLQLP